MGDIESQKRLGNLKKLLRSFAPKRCFHPDQASCAGPIIGAHSIQKERYLREIAEQGYVMMLEHAVIAPPKFVKIGVKKATIFSGFCQHHDNVFFSPIENEWIIEHPTEYESFLFAYRAFTREALFKEMQLNFRAEMLGFKGRIESQGRRDNLLHENILNRCISENRTDALRFFSRKVNKRFPIAASTCFCWDRSLSGDLFYVTHEMREVVPPITLSVLPHDDTVLVSVASFREHDAIYLRPLSEVFELPEESFLGVISYWLVDFCENWAARPSAVAGWGSERRRRIERRFQFTAHKSDDYLTFAANIGALHTS